MYPDAAATHYQLMQKLQTVAVVAGRRAWAAVDPADLSGSWIQGLAVLTGIVTAQQERAARSGASYVTDALAAQGEYVAPDSFVDPAGFAGQAADGRQLNTLLYSPVTKVKEQLAAGASIAKALGAGRGSLDTIVRATVADAGRAAAGVNIATRPGIGYVRMLNPPSCARCSMLAGRFYRWNSGFLRHPHCDCVHVPTKGADAARDEGLIHDPYEYFRGLPESEQDRIYTKAGAQAIRDGGDIFQVVNSRRGLSYGGISADGTRRGQSTKGSFTSEGTTRRGNFRANTAGGARTKGRRLTPEAIYELNGSNRAAALADLEKYGYILPGGQNPLGSIVGQREGYGALGHGGAYGAARKRVEDAIEFGRAPKVRATMTEAERRLFDAKARWELVQQGVNPFSNPSMTPRAKVMGTPLTPEIAAQVEKDYRRWLETGGQVFK